jgi:hypothetical protein
MNRAGPVWRRVSVPPYRCRYATRRRYAPVLARDPTIAVLGHRIPTPRLPPRRCGDPGHMPSGQSLSPCQVNGCAGTAIARGWCRRHYGRWHRTGDPGPAGPYPLARDQVCTVDGCDQPQHSRGWCATHYQRCRTTGTTNAPPPKPTECSVEGCDREPEARGWCVLHYHRWLRTGDPGPAELLRKPTRGRCAVDGCAQPDVAKGMCRLHYERWSDTGEVGPVGRKNRIRASDQV